MTPLYKIAEEYRQQLAELEAMSLDDVTFNDTLEAIGGDFDAKAESMGAMVKNLLVESAALQVAISSFTARKFEVDRKAKAVTEYLHKEMVASRKKSVSSAEVSLEVKSLPDILSDNIDINLVPKEYLRQPETPPPEPMKNEIKKLIKEHGPVPWATLTTGRTKLEIR